MCVCVCVCVCEVVVVVKGGEAGGEVNYFIVGAIAMTRNL